MAIDENTLSEFHRYLPKELFYPHKPLSCYFAQVSQSISTHFLPSPSFRPYISKCVYSSPCNQSLPRLNYVWNTLLTHLLMITQTGNKAPPLQTPTIDRSLTQQTPNLTTSGSSNEPLLSQDQLSQCLHATHTTNQQLRQTFKCALPDRKALQLIALHLRIQFTLVHYLFPTGTSFPQKSLMRKLSTRSANQCTVFPPQSSYDPKSFPISRDDDTIKSLETIAITSSISYQHIVPNNPIGRYRGSTITVIKSW